MFMVIGVGASVAFHHAFPMAPQGSHYAVVFAAERLRKAKGAYFPTESSHLFSLDVGAGAPEQLTAGPEADTQPCLSQDRRHILFWRQPDEDLIGPIKLCSINLDGTGFKVLRSFDDLDTDQLVDIARATTVNERFDPIVVPAAKSDWGEKVVVRKHKADQFLESSALMSPDGRYATLKMVSSYVLDRRTGKLTKLPEIRSKQGGTDVPESVAWLDEHTLISGYYAEASNLIGIEAANGRHYRQVHVFNVVHGKRVDCKVFGNTQWQQNGVGSKATRLRSSGNEILLQSVERTEDGGHPSLFCFKERSGRVRFELSGEFLQEASPDKTHFLTTGWDWGTGFETDGAVPLQKLHLWDAGSVRSTPIGFPLMTCSGAVFLPTTKRP